LQRIGEAERVGIGAPTAVEASIVLSARWRFDATRQLLEFLREAEAEVIPFGVEHFEAAADAFLRYGKGRHPAALNFGDCLTYAVASVADLPLLFTGDDFGKTGIGVA
jgi:ribonuclease VapC